VLPAERRDVPHRLRPDTEIGGGELQVARIPQDDRCDEQVQPRSAVGLVLEGTVAHLAQAAEEDRAGERVPGLPLVEPRLRASAQVDVAAAVRGRRGGRPPVVTTDKFRRARDLIAKGLTVREAAVRLKVGKTALYQALRTAQA